MREILAAHAHNMWSGWMKYLYTKGCLNMDGSFLIEANSMKRWIRQMNTPYSDLPEEEKVSDRKEADGILKIIQPHNKSINRDKK